MIREDLRYPRREHLRKQKEFDLVRQTGRAATGRFVVVSILDNPDDRARRVGFIVSKRIGNAVCRNRTRRRLREIYRNSRHGISVGIWMVIIARQSVTTASYRELERDVLNTYMSIKRTYPCL